MKKEDAGSLTDAASGPARSAPHMSVRASAAPAAGIMDRREVLPVSLFILVPPFQRQILRQLGAAQVIF